MSRLIFTLITWALLGMSPAARAESPRALPLGELLDARGFLDPGSDYEGAIDPSGWTLVSEPGSSLRFGRTGAEEIDGDWLPGYGAHRGCPMDNVFAMVREASGTIYIGGSLDHCDSTVSNNIFAFDPISEQFTALGDGLNGPVRAMTIHQGQLVVGGLFDRAGDVVVNRLARWTGSQWLSLGGGVQHAEPNRPEVLALASVGGDLYVGGDFDQVGSLPANNIARFTAGQWHALGEGTDNQVRAIETAGALVFVGGAFSNAGGVPAARLARWNGSAWSSVGSSAGLPSPSANALVYSLRVVGTDLWIGGRFSVQINGQPGHALVRWNSANDSWTAIWGEEMSPLFTTVYDITNIADTVYVAGNFSNPSEPSQRSIAAWNNGQWLPLHSGEVGGAGFALLAAGGQLLFGGRFNRIDDLVAINLARWDGSSWHAVAQTPGLGLSSAAAGLVRHQDHLVASGFFTSAGGELTRGVARLTGDGWHAMDQGLPGFPADLVVHGGQLFAAISEFDVAPRVMRWTGSQWQQIGATFEVDHSGHAELYALGSHAGSLYVGGSFDRVGAIEANNIARWSGSSWEPLQDIGGNGVGGIAMALASTPDGLVVGGTFSSAGGAPAQRIARWSGSNWFNYGQGFNGGVRSVATHQGQLYAAGTFSMSGDAEAKGIARWNGSTWVEVGGGLTTPAHDGSGSLPSSGRVLHSAAEGLWVGGDFEDSGPVKSRRLALWDGQAWRAAGRGPDRGVQLNGGFVVSVSSLLVEGDRVHVGGSFGKAGDQAASNFAVFRLGRDERVFANGFESGLE